MLDFLGEFHQFPCGGKDGLVSLFLPELNVERTIGESLRHQSRLPRRT